VGGGKVSVGTPFYNATFVPLMIPVLLACTMGAMLSWKRADLSGVLGRLKLAFIGVVIVVVTAGYIVGITELPAALGFGVAAWLVLGSAVELGDRIGLFRLAPGDTFRRAAGLPPAAWGLAIAHGAGGIIAFRTESIQLMRPGEEIMVAGYSLRFDGATAVRGPNYTAARGQFTVSKNGDIVTVLTPEKRNYPAEGSNTTEAGIRTTIAGDLYTVLGEQTSNGAWSTRIYFNPLVAWIWIGAILMAVGGMVSLTDRRYRVGAPKPAKSRSKKPAPGTAEA
jgi:cytochrome c-type biogenesis protein CcmF